MPILLRDSSAIFLLIILNWPQQIHRDTYRRIVNTIFTFNYIQSLFKCILQTETDKIVEIIKSKKETTTNFKTFSDYSHFIADKLERISDERKIVINKLTVSDPLHA